MILLIKEKIEKERELKKQEQEYNKISFDYRRSINDRERLREYKKDYHKFNDIRKINMMYLLEKISDFKLIDLCNMTKNDVSLAIDVVTEMILKKIYILKIQKEEKENIINSLKSDIDYIDKSINRILKDMNDDEIKNLEMVLLSYIAYKHELKNDKEVKVYKRIDYRDVPKVKIKGK